MLELLFDSQPGFITPQWQRLRELAPRFLSCDTLRQYVGYSRGQVTQTRTALRLNTLDIKKLAKKVYHVERLTIEAERIVRGLPPYGSFPDGPERDRLLAIRGGKFNATLNDLLDDCEKRLNAVLASATSGNKGPHSATSCPLPDSVDPAPLQQWLVEMRRESMRDWVNNPSSSSSPSPSPSPSTSSQATK